MAKMREYQDQVEARPDRFIRYEYPKLLDASREAVARLINAPVDTVVFVENTTEGVNTILRNLKWEEDGKDVFITFSTVYEGCGKAVDYLVDYYDGKVTNEELDIQYPVEDDEILRIFRDAVKALHNRGKRPRICMFDVVSSRPGVLFPWKEMIKACKELGVMSLVDGAQGVGMVYLDVGTANPDFFVSNCHKWLHTPRGCAVFQVPFRNQPLLPSTLATSHGYVPKTRTRTTPLPPQNKSKFILNFEFAGTKDNAPYLCVKDALEWRQSVGGEDKIIAWLHYLNKAGSALVADGFGTKVLNNSKGTMTDCGMANVPLPVWIGEKGKEAGDDDVVVPKEEAEKAFQWMLRKMYEEYNTFIVLYAEQGRFWTRLSAQVYLDLADYEFVVRTLKSLFERVRKGEYNQ